MGRLKYFLILITLSFAACNKNSDHIKSSINTAAGSLIKEDILAFADTIDNLSRWIDKQESLVYTLGNYSFHVSRYLNNSQVSLYIEHGSSNDYGYTEKRYYLKDGKVVLYIKTRKNTMSELPFKTTRSFYADGDLLYSDQKSAKTENELISVNYLVNNTPEVHINDDMKKLSDAIYQRGQFDLVFFGITEYPKAKYLIFSRNNINAYRAPILVEKEDDFIKAISLNPEKYRGRKLKITWTLRNPNEAVYVSGGLP